MINLGTNYWGFDLEAIKSYYKAQYVGDFPLPVGDGFWEEPVSIFWQNHTKQEHGPYFGYFKKKNDSRRFLVNANYITGFIFNGLQLGDEIVYSRYRKDHRVLESAPESGAFIEGGFDYRKWDKGSVEASLCRLQVQEGKVIVL